MKTLSMLASCFILMLIGNSIGQGQTLPSEFSKLVEANALRFALPPGFSPTPVFVNDDVAYDFAVKSTTKKLEIRYRIWPLKPSSQSSKVDINSVHQAMLLTMALNISNGKQGPVQAYPDQSVKEEFGADAGATTVISCDSDFGKGYLKCLISVIHKENTADAYVFFLFDDPQVVGEAIMTDKTYHALRFN
jgi:hypothetical protein